MSREIKFRGLTPKNHWICGDLIHDEKDTTVYYDTYSQRIYMDHHSNSPVRNGTVGQYTGLLDKNGKEIYEGDILRIFGKGYNEQVKFNYGFYSVGFNILNDVTTRAEVIGNIHENPELLSLPTPREQIPDGGIST